MTLLTMLRAVAMTMAVVAFLDPSLSRARLAPAAVDVRLSAGALASDEMRAAAVAVEERLYRELGGDVEFHSAAPPAARVYIGDGAAIPADHERLPVSTVAIAAPPPAVRIVAVNDPAPVPIGWAAGLTATIEARGLAGTTTTIVLEENGTEIARAERKWSQDRERQEVSLPLTPAREGLSRIVLRAQSAPSEAILSDNAVDIALIATGRPLRIFVHEPRPSWSAAFVRRALEASPTFEVATLTYASRRIAVRAGAPPPSLASGSLNAYDAVIVGAPEALTPADLGALETFARVRGGTIVLLPDRRPSGQYLELVGNAEFEEMLVESPLAVQGARGVKLRASELAVPRQELPDADVLAAVEVGRVRWPLVISRPLGDGAVILSGALDAWRYRAESEDGFERFWQTLVAQAALSSPARVAVEIDPSIASPGSEVIVRARVRRTELRELGDRTVVPPIGARVIGPRGSEERIRLWPSAEQGLFEGRVKAPEPGTYDVRVDGGGATADAVLVSAPNARPPASLRTSGTRSALLAAASGGVVVASDDLGPLARHLRSLPRSEARIVVHPARSAWFMTLFTGLLCAEWLLRRKRGLA